MQNRPYPGRQVFFYSLIGGLGVSLLLIEANWQILKWAERQEGYITESSGILAHFFEILFYTLPTCLPLILLTVAVCIAKRLYREKEGCHVICFCATAVFLLVVVVSWAFKIMTTYFQDSTLWMPPADFGSALSYVWLWLCISAVMLASWASGAPSRQEKEHHENKARKQQKQAEAMRARLKERI